jgi:hypothetical protein
VHALLELATCLQAGATCFVGVIYNNNKSTRSERGGPHGPWMQLAFFFFWGGNFAGSRFSFCGRRRRPPPSPQPHTWPWSATWYCHCHCHAALAPAGLLQLEHLESQVPPRPKGFWCLALGREPVSNQGGGERGRIRRTTHHRPPEARLASQPPAGSALRRQLRAPVVGSASASSALIFFSALDPLYAVSVHKPASQSRTRTRS